MPVLRFLGGLLLLLAAITLITDITNARGGVDAGTFTVSLARHWANLLPASAASSQRAIQALSPLLWNGLVKWLLAIPAWMFFAVLGAALSWAGRRRRRINIYVN